MDFNEILNQKAGDQRDEIAELRGELFKSNQLIIDFIDSNREQMQAMRDRIKLLEELLEVHGQSLEAFDGIIRDF